nr:Cytochrome P450 monooxygenase [Marrubium vulgare]
MEFALKEVIVPLCQIILLAVFLRRWFTPRVKNQPPSPRKLPIIGNFHQLGAYPHRSLQSLSRRYGPLMLLHFGKVPVLVASSADAAREIMKNQDLVFSNRPKLSIPDRLQYGSRDVAFSPYGEYWRQVRSICVLHLLSMKRVQSFRRVREEETTLLVEKMRSSSSVVNLSEELVRLTNDVVCRVALGRKYSGDAEGRKVTKMLGEFLVVLGTFNVGDYIPWLAWINKINGLDGKVENVGKQFDEFLEGVIQQHRERKRDEFDGDVLVLDLVDTLLEFQRENEGVSPVEDDTIKAVVQDMFGAGTDTISTSLEWTIAELIRNPRTMEILQNEVRKVGGNKGDIKEVDIENMPYLKAVIKESLRLHAPVPLLIPRESTQDTKVLGFEIASGTHVLINVWAIARDPSLWKNSEEFIPERFLETNIDLRGLHFEFTPFGAGRRGCPGIAFALSVGELALAKLIHNFNFVLPNGERGQDLDMSEVYGIVIRRKHPLLLVATSHSR